MTKNKATVERLSMRIAIMGEPGSYSDEALAAYAQAHGLDLEGVSCRGFRAAMDAVASGDADEAFLPLENSLQGTVAESLEAILASDLHIVGEHRHKIVHCLIGQPDAELGDIKEAFSHEQAIRQCRDFLDAHGIRGHHGRDTAGSLQDVKARGSKTEAGIAGQRAAELTGMKILREGIQSREHNFTRFVHVSAKEHDRSGDPAEAKYLTTLMFTTRHRPGALHACLGVFADRGINLSKLESRPRLDKPWSYIFLVDLDGHREDEAVKDALSALLVQSASVRVLGSYPASA
ncbi:MAG: prephenate dehydratase [Thermoplasmatota archaeon]